MRKAMPLPGSASRLEAIISYDQALEIEPDNPKTLYQKGIALAQRERYDDAIKTFERMLVLEPDHPQALYYLGIAYAAGNGTRMQSGRLNDPSRYNPANALAHHFMGISLIECERYEDAIREFSEAILLDASNASTDDYQGIVYLQSGKYEEALAALNTSISMNSALTGAFTYQGITLARAGAARGCSRGAEPQPRGKSIADGGAGLPQRIPHGAPAVRGGGGNVRPNPLFKPEPCRYLDAEGNRT